MGKITPSEQNIKSFYKTLSKIISKQIPCAKARDLLLKEFEPDLLAGILESYYHVSIAFEELIIEESDDLMELMVYFLSINPDILTKPLKVQKDVICRDTALTFYTEEGKKKHYLKVYEWIKQNAEEPLKAEIQRMDMLERLLDQACSFIKNYQFSNFQTLMQRTALETCLDLLSLYKHNKFAKMLLEPENLLFLMFLLDRDARILKTPYEGTTIAEILVSNQKYHLAKYLLAQKYTDSLRQEEKDMLPLIPPEEKACFPGLERGSYEDRLDIILLLTNARRNYLPILTLPKVKKFFPDFNEAFLRLANTKEEVRSSVFDAFLFKTCWRQLNTKGIALMPTIDSTEKIDLEQLLTAMVDGKNAYTTGIEISANRITPIIELVSNKGNFTHAIWPVVADGHYGLFILDLTRVDVPISRRGIYIEPSSLFKVALCQRYLDSGVTLPSFNYQYYVSTLTQQLCMQPDDFSFIFLGRKGGENSSYYVIALVILLTLGQLDLIKNPDILESLQGKFLSMEVAKAIRVCQLQLFGEAYIKYQQLTEPGDAGEDMSVDTAPDCMDNGEPAYKKSCPSRGGMFARTFKQVEPSAEHQSLFTPGKSNQIGNELPGLGP